MYYSYNNGNDENNELENTNETTPSGEPINDSTDSESTYYEPAREPECTEPYNIDNIYSPNYHSTAAYGYSSVNFEKQKKEKKPMSSGTKSFIRAVCLVLVCAIASGASAAVVTAKKLENAEYTIQNQVVLGASRGENEENADDPAVVPTGDILTGDEIYTLACQQAVGIQVTSTGTNIFGQTTTSPAVVGTGFIISSDGYIVTNYHVVESVVLYGSSRDYSLSVVMNDGTTYPVQIVGYEEENDLAVLKIDATGLNAVTIGNMSSTKVGETVYAVGNPLGELTYSMTSGIISATDRVISTEASISINVFQFDAAVNSGNSGGPVYNTKGEVIGIVDAKYQATGVEGLGFAIPIDDAMNIISDLIEHGYVTGKAYMGIYVRTVSSTVAMYYNMAEGAFIDSMDENGCAARAGLKPGDIITGLGSDEIKSSEDLKAAKSAYSAGDATTVTVYRGGETLTFEITFDEEPANNAYNQNGTNQQTATQG